jgi:paraquat-inducible protein B
MSKDSATKDAGSAGKARVTNKKPRISAIWFVPVVAVLIGGWLVFKALSEQGPLISIQFESAEGLSVDKTVVKYKGMSIGRVEAIELMTDLSGVVLKVRMSKPSEYVLTDKTRFWLVKPRIAAGQISGLGTLLSGSYIGIDPNPSGVKARSYVGLESPPAVLADESGRRFKLRGESVSSLTIGSPLYFHGIEAGRITGYELQEDGSVEFDIFIVDPYHHRVSSETRFWNAGGLDLEVNADGFRLETASLSSLLVGGVSFDTQVGVGETVDVEDGHMFRLFKSERDSKNDATEVEAHFLLFFDGTVRGLSEGAPVEFRGIPVGRVEDIRLMADREKQKIEIPVLIGIQPSLYTDESTNPREGFANLVKQGLRASLKTGNLLTGQKYVDLAFYPDAPKATMDTTSYRYGVIPTTGSSLEAVATDFQELLQGLQITVARVNGLLEPGGADKEPGDVAAMVASLSSVAEQIDTEMAPGLSAAIVQAEQVLANAQTMLADDGITRVQLNRLLIELTETIKSIREAADYLEQKPNSIIFGKDE